MLEQNSGKRIQLKQMDIRSYLDESCDKSSCKSKNSLITSSPCSKLAVQELFTAHTSESKYLSLIRH